MLGMLIHHPCVSRIVDMSELSEPPEMYHTYSSHESYVFVANQPWLTYNHAIKYAINHLPKNEVICLLNSDVWLGRKSNWGLLGVYLDKCGEIHQKPIVFTCTRHEWGGTEDTSTMEG